MVLAVLAVCGSCSLFSHNEGDGEENFGRSAGVGLRNSAGYHQPSSNYSLPQCPNKDTSLHCPKDADPCVTTMEEKNRSRALPRGDGVFVDEI